jgi:hypothetical protein
VDIARGLHDAQVYAVVHGLQSDWVDAVMGWPSN